jgi:alanine-glyoxylate transaminase/serine-glyoxylate transaminase/serine-pyruvate transaminase
MAIPGPSVMPERVLRAMQRSAPNIYAGELVDITASIKTDLKQLAGCSGDLAIYIGNGHAAWEASICNTFSKGDKALCVINGRFGRLWASIARSMGVEIESLDAGDKLAADPIQLEAALKADSKHNIKAVLSVQTDTASSSTNDIAALRAAIDSANHPALLIIDSIASFGCEPFNMDNLGVDVMITASQKGLMTVPGVAFMFTNEKFWSHQKHADLVTPYWDAAPRVNPPGFTDNFNGTPPTHHLYGLREALDMLLEEGIENTWQRHESIAHSVWAAINVWGEQGNFECNIADVKQRSKAVTTINTPQGIAQKLQQVCHEHFGVILGVGLNPDPKGGLQDNVFRIGHMGHLNPPMILGTLGVIEAGLEYLNVQRGRGAVDAAAAVLAGSARA